MKKIFIVISDLTPGGAQKQILILAKRLSASYKVYLITWQNSESDFYAVDEDKITRVTLSNKFVQKIGWVGYIFRIIKMRKFVDTISPNLIIAFLPEISTMAILSTLLTPIPLVASLRHHPGPEKLKIRNRLYYKIVTSRAVCIFQSDQVLNWFEQKYNLKKKSYVIQNFFDDYNNYKKILRKSSKLEKDSYFLAVGTKVYQKGFDILLQAFDEAVEKGVDKCLVIIGITSKKEIANISRCMKKVKNKNKIKLISQSSEINRWMLDAYCFILSSRFEGIPNVLIEAIENNKAIIAFDCPSGPKDLLLNGFYGKLIGKIDHIELTNEIINFSQDANLPKLYEDRLLKIKHEAPHEIGSKWISIIENYAN